MDLVAIFNAAEAIWWTGVAAVVLAVVRGPRRRRIAAAVLLLLFGLSDLVEIWSGAWWRPWWLAAWKITCGLAIAIIFLITVLQARRSRQMSSRDDGA